MRIFGFRIEDLVSRFSGSGLDFEIRVPGSGFLVSGSGSRVSGFSFQVLGFGFLVLGSGFRVPGSGFHVPGFGLRVSSFEFWISSFGLQGLVFRFGVLGPSGLQTRGGKGNAPSSGFWG